MKSDVASFDPPPKTEISASKFTAIIAVIPISWGLGIAAFQGYYWLRYHMGWNISVLDALIFLDDYLPLLRLWELAKRLPPDAYRALDNSSLALLFVVIGLTLLVVASFMSRLERRLR
jgi:hypothetical protein